MLFVKYQIKSVENKHFAQSNTQVLYLQSTTQMVKEFCWLNLFTKQENTMLNRVEVSYKLVFFFYSYLQQPNC